MKKSKLIIFSYAIVLLVIFLGIGYSAFNKELIIDNYIAKIRANVDIRVTDFFAIGQTNNGLSSSTEYNVNSIMTDLYLPELSSTVTYTVQVTNIGNTNMTIYNIEGLNSDLDYTITDYTLKDKICDAENECTSGIIKEFEITIKYKTTVQEPSTENYIVTMNFDFRPVYTLTYINSPSTAYPTEIISGENLSLNYNNDNYTITQIYNAENTTINQNDIVIQNGTLTINNVLSNITINFEQTFSSYLLARYNSSNRVTVSNNHIDFNYANSVGMMNDRYGSSANELDDGNIRYLGKSPNNYIYFNCSDYEDQSSSTCQIWRIIGVFKNVKLSNGTTKNLVKIVKQDSVGSLSWDNKLSGLGSSTEKNGSNSWTDARLMMLLNDGYETGAKDSKGNIIYEYEGSLYYNGKQGTCYAGTDSGTKACDFRNSGLKNDITRNLIEEVIWNLGSVEAERVTDSTTGSINLVMKEFHSDEAYVYETSNNTNNGATTLKAKVGLASVADYGYSTNFGYCYHTLTNYNTDYNDYACRSNSWFYSGKFEWLLNPVFVNTTTASEKIVSRVSTILSSGTTWLTLTNNSSAQVRPAVYLTLDTALKAGNGSSSNPYQLEFYK